MAIPSSSCFDYHVVLHGVRGGALTGTARDDGSPSLLGSRPSVVVTHGRVTLTRGSRGVLSRPLASTTAFDTGDALEAVLREGDELSCWRDETAEIGLSVTRAGSLLLGLGTLGRTPVAGIAIDYDPRVDETETARDIHYIDRPATRIVWLDPQKPREMQARLRELDGDFTGTKLVAIVVRTDDETVLHELNQQTMVRRRPRNVSVTFLAAAERFTSVDEWLEHGRRLSTKRPADLWLRIRSGSEEALVVEGTTAAVDCWLVHVLRVYTPGEPGQLSQLGLVRADLGVTASMLERSTAAVERGLHF